MENSEKQRYRAIGERIQQAREQAGLTQEQLAVRIGYKSATAMSFIEAGERRLRVGDLQKIADTLKQDYNFLMTGKTEKGVTVRTALRSEHKDLTQDSIDKIESFISWVKSEQQDGRGTGTKK